MPAKIWYIDPTQAPGHSDPSWVGPYGTGHRVQAWSQAARATDNWYFGLGGATGPVASFWHVTQDAVRLGSYGSGRHIMDFTSATLQGSGTRCDFRVYGTNFKVDFLHIKGTANDVVGASLSTVMAVDTNGLQGLSIKSSILQGPGALVADYNTGSIAQRPIFQILSTASGGDWEFLDNELFGFNTGMSMQVLGDSALIASNRIRALTGTDGGNCDCIIVSHPSSTIQYANYKVKIFNNELSGFYDQAVDFISANGIWFEGNKIYNTDVPGLALANEAQNTAGMITGGHGTGGTTNSGFHLIARNDIYVVLRPGMTYTGVPAIESRGGNGSLVVANRLVGQGGGWRTTATSGTPDGTLKGRDNTLINNTLVALGTNTSNDFPIEHKKGVNLQVTNCALISGTAGIAAVDQEEDNITLRGCRTNSSSWRRAGSAGAFDIDGTNALSQTMPTGPDYFPNAALLGAGQAQARKWADLYGVQLPDSLVGGIAPDARTIALPGVTRKWWKGWTKPSAVLA